MFVFITYFSSIEDGYLTGVRVRDHALHLRRLPHIKTYDIVDDA